MKILAQSPVVLSFLLTFGLSSCASHPDPGRTHDPHLLDDKVTTSRVLTALKQGGADCRHIQVQTTNGVVVLTGNVRNPESKQRAEALARSVSQVKTLKDAIEVER